MKRKLVALLEIIAQCEVRQRNLPHDVYGETGNKYILVIDSRQNAKEKVGTLLHEAIHHYRAEHDLDPHDECAVVREEAKLLRWLYDKPKP